MLTARPTLRAIDIGAIDANLPTSSIILRWGEMIKERNDASRGDGTSSSYSSSSDDGSESSESNDEPETPDTKRHKSAQAEATQAEPAATQPTPAAVAAAATQAAAQAAPAATQAATKTATQAVKSSSEAAFKTTAKSTVAKTTFKNGMKTAAATAGEQTGTITAKNAVAGAALQEAAVGGAIGYVLNICGDLWQYKRGKMSKNELCYKMVAVHPREAVAQAATCVGLAAAGLEAAPFAIACAGFGFVINVGNNALYKFKEKKALGFNTKNAPRQPAENLPSAP
eukprot:CAMPEP_0205926654 /NCGR_PEP_ID=MMETSP1325-20131115/20944_1 /ASSEMBLY_ACC=CAM_ASM_000708 /TAXON_ID=236786 /ORGANISM="Florenciella sp., Strain RCC1007" /LENGTH=283 /DNA_ID=CAMNT_0053295413 /DNA_START=8 /DNA_END=860 /DNA_ORIENTATION=-